jgi:fatty acid omega-hydroxylase
LDSISGKDVPFATAFDSAQKVVSERFVNPFYKIKELFNRSLTAQIKAVRSFGADVVAKRRLENNVGGVKSDLLQLFIDYRDENGKGLDDEALVDQVINFIIAGRDTTAQTISWLLFCLSQNPGVTEKVLEEANLLVGDGEITYETVKSMEYAKAVFKETLRLYPSVSRNLKQAVADDILPNGTRIAAGTQVGFSAYAMGRSAKIWDNPLEFNPERWIGTAVPTPYKFPAFNAGPRICIGRVVAELQGVFVFVTLLRKFEIEVANPENVCQVNSLTLPMKYGMMCKLTKRK